MTACSPLRQCVPAFLYGSCTLDAKMKFAGYGLHLPKSQNTRAIEDGYCRKKAKVSDSQPSASRQVGPATIPIFYGLTGRGSDRAVILMCRRTRAVQCNLNSVPCHCRCHRENIHFPHHFLQEHHTRPLTDADPQSRLLFLTLQQSPALYFGL